jgi:osmotically-inducible protein OsmY
MGLVRILLFVSGLVLAIACQRKDNNTNASPSGGSSDIEYHSTGRAAQTNENPAQYDANNTGRNQRDRSGNSLTPEDQGGNDTDREITRQIRRAITSNDQLSTEAKNVKVVTINGTVTLRGPVNSAQEQQAVANLAKGVTGVNSVVNQLEVKQNQ